MKRKRRDRVLAGYTAGAACVILVVAAAMGAAFPAVLLVAPFIAVVLGLVVVLPVYLLLDRLGQLRPWWSALLGCLLTVFTAWKTIPAIGQADFAYLVMRRNFHHQLEPDWLLIGLAMLGAAGGVIGWLVAYGRRLTPPQGSQQERQAKERQRS
jgi:hypothetical protein